MSDARTSFVGRVEELDRLRGLVAAPGLVTTVGPGGTGKTRLVSELALRDASAVPGGVWLVELASLESAHQVTPAIGAALGLTAATLGEIEDVLRTRGRCLLVLDNCEHLLDGVVDLVEPLLASCPELTILCTSREALNLTGERAWTLPPLPADGAATQLFLDRASDATDATPDLDLVFQLCEALDGLPLAIELAASQVRAAPLQEILAAVTTGTDALERRGGESRQRSLDAVLQWSLDRLAPEVRASLLVLSVFPGRFSPEMGKAVLEAAPHGDPAALKVLARASLVDLDGADYRLLWTIRDAARRLLDQDPDAKRAAMDALATWAAAYGADCYGLADAPDHVADDTALAVQVALDHGLEVGAVGLGRAWRLTSLIAHRRGAGPVTIALAHRAVQVVPEELDSAIMVASAVQILEQEQKDSGVAPDTFETLRSIAAEAADVRVMVLTLHSEAIREGNLGHWDRSITLVQQALELTERHDEARHRRASMLVSLSHMYYYSGDRARAIEYNLLAMEAAVAADDWVIQALAHINLAEIALIEDRRAGARDHALAALKISPPHFQWRGSALSMLARALVRLGDQASALAAGRQALPLFDPHRANPEHAEERELLLAELPELRT